MGKNEAVWIALTGLVFAVLMTINGNIIGGYLVGVPSVLALMAMARP